MKGRTVACTNMPYSLSCVNKTGTKPLRPYNAVWAETKREADALRHQEHLRYPNREDTRVKLSALRILKERILAHHRKKFYQIEASN